MGEKLLSVQRGLKMLYSCGSYKGYTYIYDTEDNSCELVSSRKLNEIDVHMLGISNLDFNKLRMLYGIESVNDKIQLCSYGVEFGEYYYCDEINLCICLGVPTSCDMRFSIEVGLYNVRDIMGRYRHIHSVPDFYDRMNFWIPVQMMDYLIRLSKSGASIYDFDRVMSGALLSNLYIVVDNNRVLSSLVDE